MLVYNVQYLVHDDDEEDDAIVLQSLGVLRHCSITGFGPVLQFFSLIFTGCPCPTSKLSTSIAFLSRTPRETFDITLHFTH